MTRISLALISGLLAGVVATFVVLKISDGNNAASQNVIRDIANIRTMDYGQSIEHRKNHFSDLNSIESIQSLPTEFIRNEALYALAGRSNSTELNALALEARRIADPAARNRTLGIVFFRLTEIDPQLALALVQSAEFSQLRGAEARVWQTLVKSDLMTAIVAARSLPDTRQQSVVQIMYGAVGGAYTDEARVIEDELGIAPNASNRAIYLYLLADESPAKALAHILSLESEKRRISQTRTLASMLARLDLESAEEFAVNIEDATLHRHYLETVFSVLGRDDPILALEKKLAINAETNISKADRGRLAELAKSDLDRVLRLLSLATDKGNHETLASIIVGEYARQRPNQAFEWVREESGSESGPLMKALYKSLAVSDTDLALRHAQTIENVSARSRMTLSIIDTVAKTSPQQAAAFLDQISAKNTRTRAAQKIATKWLEEDAVGAIDWLLTSDPEISEAVFRNQRAADNIDLDEVQAIVMNLPDEHRDAWARGVVVRLAKDRSPEAALQFVRQFEGQADFEMQMAHLATTVAKTDPELAASWAENIQTGMARDAALANVVSVGSRENPADAALLLQKIDDPDLRQVSTSDVMRRWYKVDADAAAQWLDALPRGPERDNIVMNTSFNMGNDEERRTTLIDSIDDPDVRQQAQFMASVFQSRGDPEEQLRLLEKMDMPDIFRQQIKAQILRSASRGF